MKAYFYAMIMLVSLSSVARDSASAEKVPVALGAKQWPSVNKGMFFFNDKFVLPPYTVTQLS